MYLVVLIITIKRRWEGLTKADFADVPFRLTQSLRILIFIGVVAFVNSVFCKVYVLANH